MRLPIALSLLATLGLAAQAPPPAAEPAPPAVKWRGALWASGAASDRQTADGSLFLRPVDSGDGRLALDGLQLGADVALPDGWAFKVTLLAGQTAKVLNAATLASGSTPAETGSIAWPEAMLTWTGKADTLKIGRMYTAMGMEVMDGTQDLTASRGLLFTFAIPFAQVGLNWHHAFSAAWSTDVWVYNGEDRIQDNNRGKTVGLGLTYNHGGAADKFVTLMAFSGAEQDAFGAAAWPGAEGRKRNRASMAGSWVWGNATLLWEAEYAQETLASYNDAKAHWSGLGFTYKYQFSDRWNVFARAETLKDPEGVRFSGDTSIAQANAPVGNLQGTSFCLGVERRWHATFTRFEVRRDAVNQHLPVFNSRTRETFRDANSATWSVGTSF